MAESFEYGEQFDRLALLIRAAAELDVDLESIQRAHAHAEAVGPILEPTKWQWGGGARNLADQRAALRVAVPFVREARRFVATMAERHGIAIEVGSSGAVRQAGS